ncbi:hypothetical protein ASPZODRAFT_159578 [Penicilliopsis zonata CBS 506.65]|uniref:FAD dependent oxidoreductase domain-containing protein n=1 Tax=Penicilliopsis zonata CBS 506.65 TaxID=1073090 RepID=A0A1L9SID5_9EURO|nr:hypothetical protein ASPZODRAFT_159578 [Penicilliopsis zonata CBS 506.65]OJJ46794.1 hypothetical protein ASPZODRAFT_159578 [Penicilliopsis zonata CBS 506.65]
MSIPSYFPAQNPLPSYWLKDPHPLASFRSSDNVPPQCDIAIIGTGLAGVATAYHILSDPSLASKPNVVLLEARQACTGATGRNGGHLKLATWIGRNTSVKHGKAAVAEVIKNQLDQIAALKEVVEKENIDCEFHVTRSFDIFFDEGHAQEMQGFVLAHQSETWSQHIHWVDASELAKITGIRNSKGAFSVPAASLWPYKLVTALLSRVLELGGTLYTETYVTKVEESDNQTILTTSRGVLNAHKTIFATNAYTAALLPQYEGIITPFKGQNSHLSPSPSFHPEMILDNTYNLHFNKRYADYLNPRPDHTIILGGAKWTYEDILDRAQWWNTTDDTTLINDAATEHFDTVMADHFHGWEGAKAHHDFVWTGIMGETPDALPHVGKVPGMTMIFTTARAVARMVVHGVTYEDTDLPSVFRSTAERLAVKNPGF